MGQLMDQLMAKKLTEFEDLMLFGVAAVVSKVSIIHT